MPLPGDEKWRERDRGQEGDGSEEDKHEIRDEDVKQLYNEEAQLCSMPEAPDPKLFVEGLSLRRYQRQALAWMIQREKRRFVTEEDCTGLSLGVDLGTSSSAERRRRKSPTKDGCAVAEVTEVTELSVTAGNNGNSGVAKEEQETVVMLDGRVHVTSWDSDADPAAAGGDCGGGPGVAMHPLWERRAAASLVCAAPLGASGLLNLAGGGSRTESLMVSDRESSLSNPEFFYVNIYSRRFQRQFPPAALGCRGGILADEMGMGKVRKGMGRHSLEVIEKEKVGCSFDRNMHIVKTATTNKIRGFFTTLRWCSILMTKKNRTKMLLRYGGR